MTRKELIAFVNECVLPGAEISISDWQSSGKEIFWDILHSIQTWRIGKVSSVKMDCRILDGVLWINGESVKRVASKLPRVEYSESAHYWEGRCLAKSEEF